MKTKLFIIVILLILSGLLQSCWPFYNINLGNCLSSSIEWAKKHRTFLSEYFPGHIKINDSIQFTIKQVFAENQFGYYSHWNPFTTIKKNKSQIVVITEKSIDKVKGFSNTWNFSNLGYGVPGILYIDFNDSIPPDTIRVDILRNDINPLTFRAGSRDEEKIGSFKLVKKFNKNMP